MKNKLAGLMMGIVVVVFLGACGNETTANEAATGQNDDTLIVGLDDTFAPMGFRDNNGDIVGFDIDLANEVGERIGKEMEFQSIDWAMKETELNAGNIDLIWNGYTITDERAEKVAFSTPYMENSQIIVVLEDSEIQTKEDLERKTVAAQQSSSAVDAILADESNIAESFNNGEIVQYPSNNDVFNDLASERSDAIVVDETLGRYYMKQNEDIDYRVLEDSFGEEEYAVGLRKEDSELKKEIDQALSEIIDEGIFDQIYDKWFAD